jgi:hypothetical protein
MINKKYQHANISFLCHHSPDMEGAVHKLCHLGRGWVKNCIFDLCLDHVILTGHQMMNFLSFVIVMVFNHGRVLKFGASSRYYKGALSQGDNFERIGLLSDLILMSAEKKIKTNIQNSTLNLPFYILTKRHDPQISKKTTK